MYISVTHDKNRFNSTVNGVFVGLVNGSFHEHGALSSRMRPSAGRSRDVNPAKAKDEWHRLYL